MQHSIVLVEFGETCESLIEIFFWLVALKCVVSILYLSCAV